MITMGVVYVSDCGKLRMAPSCKKRHSLKAPIETRPSGGFLRWSPLDPRIHPSAPRFPHGPLPQRQSLAQSRGSRALPRCGIRPPRPGISCSHARQASSGEADGRDAVTLELVSSRKEPRIPIPLPNLARGEIVEWKSSSNGESRFQGVFLRKLNDEFGAVRQPKMRYEQIIALSRLNRPRLVPTMCGPGRLA